MGTSHYRTIQKKVVEFYLQSDISRTFPGKKDTISVKIGNQRENIQKQLLLYNLSDIHKKFIDAYPAHQVQLTTFSSLRPKQCVFAGDSSAHNVCVCHYHENVNFLIERLRQYPSFGEFEIEKGTEQLFQKLMELAKCEIPSEACELQSCNDCDARRMITYVADKLDADNVTEINYKTWVTTPTFNLMAVVNEVDEFLDSLRAQIEYIIVHDFKVRKQHEFVKKRRVNLFPESKCWCI